MNKKALQWLHKELPDLVHKGILSQEAAHNLRVYYGDAKSADRKWFVIILCSVLGALLIGLGIILLFGHNWEELSRPMRMILSLLPLIAGQIFTMWVVVKKSESHALKEASATFLSLMVGASTALISQTYNISGDTPSFILTWMVLILPLVYLMQATIPGVIFIAGISAWSWNFWDEPSTAFLFWPLAAVIIPHFVWSLRQKTYTIRATLLALVIALSCLVTANLTLGRFWAGSWVIIYSILTAGFYLLGAWKFKEASTNWQRPLQIIGGVGSFLIMFGLTFKFPWESISRKYWNSTNDIFAWAAIPGQLLTFVLLAAVTVLLFQYVKKQDWLRTLFGALPLFALIGYVFSAESPFLATLLFSAFLFAISVYHLMIGIKTNSLSLINTGMFMLSALVLAKFFDSEINFIFKGLVFIFIGVCFLATNIVILRRKGAIA